MTPRTDFIDEDFILGLGFKPTEKDKEWPYTMIYKKGEYTLQYIYPWGQGDDMEGYKLKRNGIRIEFRGTRDTVGGFKLPNDYFLYKSDIEKAINH